MLTTIDTTQAQYEQFAGIEPSTEKHEEEKIHKAADVLPPELVEGEYHRVLSPVRNDCSVDFYTLDTPFGNYEVYGQSLLRVRIREAYALASMQEISGDEVVWEAAQRVVTSPFKAIANFARKPVATMKSIPASLNRTARFIGEDVSILAKSLGKDGAGDTLNSDNVSRASWALMGLDSSERRWAKKLQIDPYSNNETLRERLKAIAKIDSSVSFGLSFAPLPKLLEGGGLLNSAYDMVWDLGPRSLLDLNYKRLLEMGASEELILAYFNVESLTIWHDVLLINLMEAMEGVVDRPLLIEAALTVESDSDALFFVESVAMAYWFHSNESPLRKFLPGSGVPMAHSEDGRTVLFSASDWACWDIENDQAAVYFTEAYLPSRSQGEVWLAGGASDMFSEGVGNLGWRVRVDTRDQVLPWIMETESREPSNEELNANPD